VIGPLIDPASRESALRALYARLRFADACCVVGINDVGKTTLLALLQQPAVLQRYAPDLTEPRVFVHVDCNLLAGAGELELYTLLAAETRAAARRAGVSLDSTGADSSPDKSALLAAVAFDEMLVELVDLGCWPVIVFDEFDSLYRRLEARAALALRAFENRLGPRIAYVVAVERPLRATRGADDTAEFEELFVGGTLTLPPLERAHALAVLGRFAEQRRVPLPSPLAERLADLTGGHPGLLAAACAAAQRLVIAGQPFDEPALTASEEVAAECDNVLARLPDDERERLSGDSSPFPLLSQRARAVASRGGLVVHPETGEVTVDGAPPAVRLGPTEYRLLQLLAARSGALVTKDEIARELWPDERRLGVDDARIDKLVDRVRSKVEPDPKTPIYLVTVRGLGYRLLGGS
jgi:DNA-binding winged helix-turn-helix (wHTH) protein